MAQLSVLEADQRATYCDLWNAVWPTVQRTVPDLTREDELLGENLRRWFVHEGDQPIGYAEARKPIGSRAPTKWELTVGVLKPFRGQGHGRLLFDEGWQYLRSIGATAVAGEAKEDDPDTLRFLAKRGFIETRRGFESMLDVAEIPESIFAMAPPGEIDIVSFASQDSLEFRRKFHEIFEEVRHDVPRVDPPEPFEFERFNEVVLGDPMFVWPGSVVARKGDELVGFSGIFEGATPDYVEQWLTAVRRPYRGLGIAKAMKVEVLKWVKAQGIPSIQTFNDTLNAPMLGINEVFGFKRLPAVIFLEAPMTP